MLERVPTDYTAQLIDRFVEHLEKLRSNIRCDSDYKGARAFGFYRAKQYKKQGADQYDQRLKQQIPAKVSMAAQFTPPPLQHAPDSKAGSAAAGTMHTAELATTAAAA